MVTSTRMPKTDSVQQQMPPAGQHTCQRTALATATLSTRCPHTVVCCRSKQNDAGAASPRSAASTLCPATQRSFRLHRGLHGTGKVEKSARTRGGAGACVFMGLRLRRDSSTLRIGDVVCSACTTLRPPSHVARAQAPLRPHSLKALVPHAPEHSHCFPNILTELLLRSPSLDAGLAAPSSQPSP